MSEANKNAIKKEARAIAAGQRDFIAQDAIALKRWKEMVPVLIPLSVRIVQVPPKWNRFGGEDSLIKNNMIIVQVIEGPRKDEFLSVNVDGKTFPRTTKFVEGREIIIDPILPKNGDIMDLMYEAYQDPNVHVSKCVLRTEAKK